MTNQPTERDHLPLGPSLCRLPAANQAINEGMLLERRAGGVPDPLPFRTQMKFQVQR